MPDKRGTVVKEKLHRELKVKDLILLNVAIIVGLSTLAQVAQLGFSSIPIFFICIFTYLIPSGLMVAELNHRMPEEGGFYIWTQRAFGDFHAFIAAWSYWLCNIVWFATLLLIVTIPALYIFGDTYLHLSDHFGYNAVFGLILIIIITGANIWGIEKAKWINNIGGGATWICVTLLVILGFYFFFTSEQAVNIESQSFVPDFTNFELLAFFAMVPFSFDGLELAPYYGGRNNKSREKYS